MSAKNSEEDRNDSRPVDRVGFIARGPESSSYKVVIRNDGSGQRTEKNAHQLDPPFDKMQDFSV